VAEAVRLASRGLLTETLMKLTADQARAHADEVRATSLTILKGLIPVETIDTWNRAFAPLLSASIAREGDNPNRGAHRYYVTLPFQDLWADPAIIDNDAIMAVVEELVGADGVMCQLASDTPMLGSEHQELHRDTQLLFPESGVETPPYQLAVNFPLVDVTDELGPMEYAPGTHMMSKADGMRAVETGEIPLVKAYMNRGDVMIRDVRHIHRGTPNRSSTPRPMVVIGYSRRWLHRPEVQIRIPADVLVNLTERARRWLRFNPVFASADEALQAKESYRAFAY
jgi:ectoine hydroxylase-related dioxygenase (phytanoyl-CoA dioxygenase family)